MAPAPQRGAQVDQRPGVRHPQLGAGEDVDRLARPFDHVPVPIEQRLHAERLADRLRRPEPPRDLELLVDQLVRPLALTEASRGERGVAAPHQRHRIHVGDGQRAPPGLVEVDQGGGGITHPQREPAPGRQRLAHAQRPRQLAGRPRVALHRHRLLERAPLDVDVDEGGQDGGRDDRIAVREQRQRLDGVRLGAGEVAAPGASGGTQAERVRVERHRAAGLRLLHARRPHLDRPGQPARERDGDRGGGQRDRRRGRRERGVLGADLDQQPAVAPRRLGERRDLVRSAGGGAGEHHGDHREQAALGGRLAAAHLRFEREQPAERLHAGEPADQPGGGGLELERQPQLPIEPVRLARSSSLAAIASGSSAARKCTIERPSAACARSVGESTARAPPPCGRPPPAAGRRTRPRPGRAASRAAATPAPPRRARGAGTAPPGPGRRGRRRGAPRRSAHRTPSARAAGPAASRWRGHALAPRRIPRQLAGGGQVQLRPRGRREPSRAAPGR